MDYTKTQLTNWIKNIFQKTIVLLNTWYKNKPYLFSLITSTIFTTIILFVSPYKGSQNAEDMIDVFQMINVDKLSLPKRKVKKDIDPDSDTENKDPDIERAEGQIDDALDLSFYPDIVPPRPIGALKKIYPESARQREVEAVTFVSIAISKSGKVLSVQVLGVKLSKSLPADLEKSLKDDFKRDAIAILTQARFTPTLLNGKKVAVIRQLPLQFHLK